MARIDIRLSIYGSEKSTAKDVQFESDSEESVLELLARLDVKGMLPKRFGQEKGYQNLLVFINHRNVASGAGYRDTLLSDQDKVVILQAVAGG